MFEEIKELSILFLKKADIKSDMAIRIVHSLIPVLESDPDLAKEKANLFIPEIINGAKYLLEKGREIVLGEMRFINDESLYLGAQGIINYNIFMDYCSACFKHTPKLWPYLYGGKPWSDFALKLKELNSLLIEFEKTTNLNVLNKIIIIMNVIDQMEHNTGSFYRRIYEIEDEHKKKNPVQQQKEWPKYERIMDSKELEHPEDTAAFIWNSIPEEVRTRYNYSLSDIRRIISKSDPQRLKFNLAKFRIKKLPNTIEHFNNFKIALQDLKSQLAIDTGFKSDDLKSFFDDCNTELNNLFYALSEDNLEFVIEQEYNQVKSKKIGRNEALAIYNVIAKKMEDILK